MRCPVCQQETIFSAHHRFTACTLCGEKFIFNPLAVGELWYALTILAAMQALSNSVNQRYWTSWWTTSQGDWPEVPFQFWATGSDMNNRVAVCALLEGPNRWHVEQGVIKYFPDAEFRFIEPRDHDWSPGDRFPVYEERVKI